jgi:hypothetical protein
MSDLSNISTRELAKDYFESYMDIARCELALLYSDTETNNHEKLTDRLNGNKDIVLIIRRELHNRDDMSVYAERQFVLGAFSL